MLVDASFGLWVKRARLSTGLTQKRLADQIGCSEITLRKIEAGQRRASSQIAERLASALGITRIDRETFIRLARGEFVVASLTEPFSEIGSEHATPIQTIGAVRTNVPAQQRTLIGRTSDLHTAIDILLEPEVQLLTLTGVGGTGKTCLALQIAKELIPKFADGVWFISLASIHNPALLLPTIAGVFGLTASSGQPIHERLHEMLRAKTMLLVLDNFEQIVQAASHLSHLLSGCPGIKILVTSRERLHLSYEREMVVPPLMLPPLTSMQEAELIDVTEYAAIQLFMVRAQAIQPTFDLTPANARTIAELCIQLDGLPLAIELAAARIRVLPPEQLLARIQRPIQSLNSQRLALLTGGPQDAPARHRALRQTVEWSYNLLSDDEQILFRTLPVFSGEWSLDTAEAIAQSSPYGKTEKALFQSSVVDILQSLIDKSLLSTVEHNTTLQPYSLHAVAHSPRYVMLETIREYALERLVELGEDQAVRQRHALYYVTQAEQANDQLRGTHQEEALQWLAAEHDNLHAVLIWSLTEPINTSQATSSQWYIALRMIAALWRFWFLHGNIQVWTYWFERVQDAWALRETQPHPDEMKLWATILRGRAMLASAVGDSQVQAYGQESLDLFRAIGDRWGAASALMTLGWIEEGLEIARDLNDTWLVAWGLLALGDTRNRSYHYARATEIFKEGLTLARTTGDRWLIAELLVFLGNIANQQHLYHEAVSYYDEALGLFKHLDNRLGTAHALHGLSDLAFDLGDYAAARTLTEERLLIEQNQGNRYGVAHAYGWLGQIAYYEGHLSEATAHWEACLVHSRAIGQRWGTAWALGEMSCIALAQHDTQLALAQCDESLQLLLEEGHRASIAWILKYKATVLLAQGNVADAANCLHQSLAYAREAGEREGIARTLADLACLTIQQGDFGVTALYAECIELWQELNDQPHIIAATEQLAKTLATAGNPAAAAYLWGAAETTRDKIGVPMPPISRPVYEKAIAAARNIGDSRTFDAAWARGRAEQPAIAIMAVCREIERTGNQRPPN